MSDVFGVRVSEKGYDVKTCPRQNLVCASDMPTLKIHSRAVYSTTIPPSGSPDNVVRHWHGLNRYTPCFVVYNGSTTIGTGRSFFFSDSLTPLRVTMTENYTDIYVDEYFDQGFSDPGATVYFTIYQFLDGFSNFTGNVTANQEIGGGTNNYGFKISKVGYDVKTCADEHLIISSKFGAANIHKKGTTTASMVAHGLPYVPQFITFTKHDGDAHVTYDWFIACDNTYLYTRLKPNEVMYYLILT